MSATYGPSWLDDPRAEDTRNQGYYLHRANEDRHCGYGRPGDFCVHVWNPARRWDSARISVSADGVVIIDTDPHGLLPHSFADLARAVEAVRQYLADRDLSPDSSEHGHLSTPDVRHSNCGE